MAELISLVGKTFGRLTVLSRGGYGKGKDIRWVCSCTCGKTKEISGISLREGRSKSCGCLRIELMSTALGQCCKTPEYVVWNAIKGRCYNKNNKDYKDYGGRGIKVCDRWLECFENFFNDMGKRQDSSYSLDRFPDNNGDYTPENCKWSNSLEQSHNRRNTKRFEYEGSSRLLVDWVLEFGVSYQSAHHYLKAHTFEDTVNHYKTKKILRCQQVY